MKRPIRNRICRQEGPTTKFRVTRLVLSLIVLAFVGCKKDAMLNTRVLEVGTKCNIVADVFALGDKQPAAPVTVISTYRSASSGLIFYNVSDSNGVIWQIPVSDLVVIN